MRSSVFTAICLLALPLGWLLADSRGQDNPARQEAVRSSPRGGQKNPGQKQAGQKNSGNNSAHGKLPVGITPEREAAVKTFVERNHPELVALLELLKANRPAEYERAIRELHRVTEKLALVQERDSQQYDLELRAWQIHSRIQLLVAKLKMGDSKIGGSDEVRNELKQSLAEQMDARAALLRHDRQRVADRLERIKKDLARLEGDRQNIVDKQFDMLTRANSPAKPKATAAGGKNTATKKSGKKAAAAFSAEVNATGGQTETNSKTKP